MFKLFYLVACLCIYTCLVNARYFLSDLPEEKMDVPEMIRYHGYTCEVHEVTTEDGYILTLHRIPSRRGELKKGGGMPVFLQHGFMDSSATWTMNPPSQSLGFILVDAGFDVWLGNSRGNVYSKKHVKYTTKDEKFWDFSFDEMAQYDVPACINYILNATKFPQLHYVGHSQGTSIAFIAFSQNKAIASKVKTFFALAPVATVAHVKGAVKVLSDVGPFIEKLVETLGFHEFMPSSALLDYLAQRVCGSSLSAEKVCGNAIFLMAGFDTSNLNDTRVPVYLSHLPAGTSVKDFIHFLQMAKSAKFQMYDYGSAQLNHQKYNQNFPPSYNVSACNVPSALYYGGQDWLADTQDVENTILPNLPNVISKKYLASWNHLDFVWGMTANQMIYNDILELMIQNEIL